MEEQIQESWWKRNWKWALPTGGCLTIIIIGIAFISYGVYKVSDVMSNKTSIFAFIEVMAEVQKNPEVAEALGKPIEIHDKDYDPELSSDYLELEMQLDGKKANGILRVTATKVNDDWVYDTFTVTVDETEEVINLIHTVND